MNRILPLIKKDFRHLAPQMCVLWVVMAIACYSNYTRVEHIGAAAHNALQLLVAFAPLICSAFVVLVIHQETLIGDRQYWLTRPFTWRDLFASKLLFVLLTLNAPLFLLQAASMALHGLPPYSHLSDLFWRQVFFTIFFLLIPAALAVITRTGGHALAAGVLIALSFVLINMLIPHSSDWGPEWANWIGDAAIAIMSLPLCAAIVILQYRRRRPAIPRVLFAVAVLLSFPLGKVPKLYGYAIQSRLSTRAIAPSEFQISLDPRSVSIWQRLSVDERRYNPESMHLGIPIRITNLSDSDRLIVNRLQLDPDITKADRYGNERSFVNSPLHDFNGGAGWLRLDVDAAAYYRMANTAIDLRVSADLTLFVRTATVDVSSVRTEVPGIGLCGPYPRGCVTALARASVEVFPDRSFATYIVSPHQTYAPFPDAYLLNPVTEMASAPGELVVRKPVAWFHRTFVFRNIRLSDYVR